MKLHVTYIDDTEGEHIHVADAVFKDGWVVIVYENGHTHSINRECVKEFWTEEN